MSKDLHYATVNVSLYGDEKAEELADRAAEFPY